MDKPMNTGVAVPAPATHEPNPQAVSAVPVGIGNAGAWTRWYDSRPTDEKALYRWRVSEREILGLLLRPEWTGKMHFCGMGYADNEWWPPFSDWNGYTRSVDRSLEWRLARDDETDTHWAGFDLAPSPFNGKPPRVISHGRWIGAPPYKIEWIGIESFMVRSPGWRSAKDMQAAWNTRAPQGIDARSGQTEGLDPKGESPVSAGNAPERNHP